MVAGLFKDFIRVGATNIIGLLSGLVSALVVPKVLGVDQYGYLRTYSLYASYIGILHFGFIDGIFLKYGGKTEEALLTNVFSKEHKFLIQFQSVVAIILITISLLVRDVFIFLIAVSVIPTNLITMFLFTYQAIGNFRIHSKIRIIRSLLILGLNLAGVFLNVKHFMYYVIAQISTMSIVAIYAELKWLFNKRNHFIFEREDKTDYKADYFELFKIGFPTMLSNLSVLLFLTVDRWFVKLFLSLKDFSYYSFSVSIINALNIYISPIILILYPYFARVNIKEKAKDSMKEIKSIVWLIGIGSLLFYYPLDFVISNFIPHFENAISLLYVLLLYIPAYIIIQSIYINILKAEKRIRDYLLITAFMVLVSIIMNTVLLTLNHSALSIAIATVITYYLWLYIMNLKFRFKGIGIEFRDTILLLSNICIYTALKLLGANMLFAFAIHLVTFVSLMVILYRDILYKIVSKFSKGDH